jgi:hypothetical protein
LWISTLEEELPRSALLSGEGINAWCGGKRSLAIKSTSLKGGLLRLRVLTVR